MMKLIPYIFMLLDGVHEYCINSVFIYFQKCNTLKKINKEPV